MKTTINFIPHSRPQYAQSFYNEITSISDNVKRNININLLISDSNSRNWKSDKDFLSKHGIETNVFLVQGGDYITKIKTAFNNSGEYIVKLDEDIFLSSKLWEFFLTNLIVLEDRKNLFLSPLLSTGIPSVDYFAEQFLTADERQELNTIYLQTPLPNIWGADYSSLEQHTIKSTAWNHNEFYNAVSKINHFYKGVHPVRFSPKAQRFIQKCVIKRFDKIIEADNFTLHIDKKPYLCNSIFGIKKDTWGEIINNKSLYRDPFDEVPFNLYMQQNDLNMVFINNGFGIHPSYNTVNMFGDNYQHISDEFFNNEYFKR